MKRHRETSPKALRNAPALEPNSAPGSGPIRVLFVCGRNRLRSPTAERIFADHPGIEAASAGLASDAETPVTADLIDWAEVILVMEPSHRRKLAARFGGRLRGKRVACLGIPDRYEFMDPDLVELLQARVPGQLGRGRRG